MKKISLPSEEILAIHAKLRDPFCSVELKLKLLCVYWMSENQSIDWVENTFFLHRHVIYEYLEDYSKNKQDYLVIQNKVNKYRGNAEKTKKPIHLSLEQREELKKHLEENPYRSRIELAEYIKNKYGIFFTPDNLTQWLSYYDFRWYRKSQL